MSTSEPIAKIRSFNLPFSVAILSVAPMLVLAWQWRDRPLDQDAPQYFALAESLAAGNGYKNPLSPWPEAETCERMPAGR